MKQDKWVGLDVHKDSTVAAVAATGRGEGKIYGTMPSDNAVIEKALKKMGGGSLEGLHVCYEAGPTGYGLYRHLKALGVDVVVVAPSETPRKPGERVKNDRRDALKLAEWHRAGELTSVRVPAPEDEGVRDVVRAREDAMIDLRRNRQRLKMFLLRHGKNYTGKSSWTEEHLRYLAKVKFEHWGQRIVYQEYIEAVNTAKERLEKMDQRMKEVLESWEKKTVVKGLMSFRGLDWLGAMSVVAEIGDIWRFNHPRLLMSYVGLTVSEDSSGNRRRQGRITKCGNRLVRWHLIEAAPSYQYAARLSEHLQRRQEGVSREVRAVAWRAQERLCGRYRRLKARGKDSNKVKVAIARELCSFIWEAWRLLEAKPQT